MLFSLMADSAPCAPYHRKQEQTRSGRPIPPASSSRAAHSAAAQRHLAAPAAARAKEKEWSTPAERSHEAPRLPFYRGRRRPPGLVGARRWGADVSARDGGSIDRWIDRSKEERGAATMCDCDAGPFLPFSTPNSCGGGLLGGDCPAGSFCSYPVGLCGDAQGLGSSQVGGGTPCMHRPERVTSTHLFIYTLLMHP